MAIAIQELELDREALLVNSQSETQTQESEKPEIDQLLRPRPLSERMAAHGRSVTIDKPVLTEPVNLTPTHSFDHLDFALKSIF